MRAVSAIEFQRRQTDMLTLGVMRLVRSHQFVHAEVLALKADLNGIGIDDRIDPELAMRADAMVLELFRLALDVGFKTGLFSPAAASHVLSTAADALASFDDNGARVERADASEDPE